MVRNLALEQDHPTPSNGRPATRPKTPGWNGTYYHPLLAFSVEYYCWALRMWGDEKYGETDHESAMQMELQTFGYHIHPDERSSYLSYFRNGRYAGDHVGVFLFYLQETLHGEFMGTIIGANMIPAESEAIRRLTQNVARPYLNRMVAEFEAIHALYARCSGSHETRQLFGPALRVLYRCPNDFVIRGAVKLMTKLSLTPLQKDDLNRVGNLHSDLVGNGNDTEGRYRFVEYLNGVTTDDWQAVYGDFLSALGNLPTQRYNPAQRR